MEDSEAVCLSKLKVSVIAPVETDPIVETSRISSKYYPFATVLRFRVLQIVCGISFLIMGTVAFIEEQGELNLGLGIPAGASTIVAAAASIHTTRGFGGYRSSSCTPGSSLRFLGPSVRIAVPLSILWGTACSFLSALVVQATRTLSFVQIDEFSDSYTNRNDLIILASLELCLALVTLSVVFLLLRIDCTFDPD